MTEQIDVLISEQAIKERIRELAEQIEKDYQNKNLFMLCILKGGVMFMVDLAREISRSVEIDFMDLSSYGDSTESSGMIKILKDLEEPIEGKDVLIVEDIIDTGNTLTFLIKLLKSKLPASIKVCTLLDKPDRRQVEVPVDYVGFTIPDQFVVGFGLDYAQKYRNLKYIGVLSFIEDEGEIS